MYILTEQVMNGTVAMSTTAIGVDAPGWTEAVLKLRSCFAPGGTVQIHEQNADVFAYTVPGGSFPVYGRMENKPLKVI